jgi:hypothetical protein
MGYCNQKVLIQQQDQQQQHQLVQPQHQVVLCLVILHVVHVVIIQLGMSVLTPVPPFYVLLHIHPNVGVLVIHQHNTHVPMEILYLSPLVQQVQPQHLVVLCLVILHVVHVVIIQMAMYVLILVLHFYVLLPFHPSVVLHVIHQPNINVLMDNYNQYKQLLCS